MKVVTVIYTFLFVYIIAAIIFWGQNLNRQSHLLYENEMTSMAARIDSVQSPIQYKMAKTEIHQRLQTRSRQYIGEGVSFLLVILIGAGVVYTSMRRNMHLTQQQNNFMLSVTHELKSPIAAVKLNLETINKRKLTEEQLKTLVMRSIKETNRLNDLCNNLLVATRMESRNVETANERLNFSEVIEDTVSFFQERNTHQIETNIEEDCFTTGDVFLWKMVVSNLIENAMKYTPADTLINVGLEFKDDNLVFTVADQGPGIADEEKDKIFKKFYRMGDENSRKTKGTGLGLYITEQIVTRHKANIVVRDNTPQGTVFEITMASA